MYLATKAAGLVLWTDMIFHEDECVDFFFFKGENDTSLSGATLFFKIVSQET